jgi:hypothetical protein
MDFLFINDLVEYFLYAEITLIEDTSLSSQNKIVLLFNLKIESKVRLVSQII